ncbi:retrovirus-related pol polyprotein from transposon TNT 1-94 [Tanacetum coccineum]
MVSAIASASFSSEYSWSKSRLKSGDLNSSRLRVLKCLLDDRNSRSGDLYAISNGGGYAVLIYWVNTLYWTQNWIRHMAYWGFLGVGTTFDIFQNIILILYVEYGVLSPLDTAYWSLLLCGLWVKSIDILVLQGCNSSFIALVPKVSNDTLVTDFRPISLIGCQYKIIGKILANILSRVIGRCISPEQSAFIKGRNLLDGPLMLNEVMAWHRTRKKQLMIFKVDFKKTFDSLKWDFLDLVMEKLGFGIKWRSWIKGWLLNARAFVLINVSPTNEFEISRGLRQSNPLSPFLFILAMEGLHAFICKAINMGIYKGISIGNNLSLSHLIYVDDVIFTGIWSITNAHNLIFILRCFFLVSGLKINVNKSNILGVVIYDDDTLAMANEVDIIKKDRKPSQNDKTEHGMEKTVKIKAKSKNTKVRVNTEESAVKPEPELKNTIGCNLNPSDGPGKPNSIFMKTGVDNRRITLIVIRARANSAVVVSLMEFVLVVLMEMEIKSIFQLRTLLINLQFIYPEPDYSLDFNSPQDLHNLQQQNLCCENCRGPHATIECQPMSQNSHSFGFDQLQTPQFSVNHQPPQPMSMEALQAQEDLMKSIESFLKKFNRISFGKTPKVLLQAWDNFFEVKHAQSEEVQELLSKLVQDVKIISDELSEYINTPAWNRPLVYCDNDDDEDYTIAITPESPTKEPVNSLSLGDEHLDTIPATESDEFIKSSVENLVPTPIEFEDFSDDECDLPPYDDSSKNHDFTFSNPLFDIDEDFTLSDESFSEEDIPKENFIIFSNPLFDLDEEIASTKVDRINDEVLEGIHSIPPGIDSFDAESDLVESVLNRDISIDSSPKIDSLSNEFAGELILPKSIPPEIEEVEFDPEGDILFLESLLYDNSSPRPPEALQANSNAIESLPPSHIPVADNDSLMEEIDLFLADDGSIPPGIESDDVDSVDDDTSISLPEFESFYVDYPNSGNSTIDVVEDIPVDVPNVLPTHPILEQDFIPTSEFFAYVVWIFLPFLAYPVIPPSLLSCGDEDTIFDPGISKDCPDCEDSQFCHSSRVSHPQLHLGIRYPNLID